MLLVQVVWAPVHACIMSMLLSLNLFVFHPLRSLSQGGGPACGGRGGDRGGPFLGEAKRRAGPNQEGGRAREGVAGGSVQ